MRILPSPSPSLPLLPAPHEIFLVLYMDQSEKQRKDDEEEKLFDMKKNVNRNVSLTFSFCVSLKEKKNAGRRQSCEEEEAFFHLKALFELLNNSNLTDSFSER
jgi:hypothetical protein